MIPYNINVGNLVIKIKPKVMITVKIKIQKKIKEKTIFII